MRDYTKVVCSLTPGQLQLSKKEWRAPFEDFSHRVRRIVPRISDGDIAILAKQFDREARYRGVKSL